MVIKKAMLHAEVKTGTGMVYTDRRGILLIIPGRIPQKTVRITVVSVLPSCLFSNSFFLNGGSLILAALWAFRRRMRHGLSLSHDGG